MGASIEQSAWSMFVIEIHIDVNVIMPRDEFLMSPGSQ